MAETVILVDNRIGSKELFPYLPGSMLTQMDSGDVAFTGMGPNGAVMVGIERKKPLDLLNCIQSGRLMQTQIPNMLRDYNTCYLIVEGQWKADDFGNMIIREGTNWRVAEIGNQRFTHERVVKFLSTVEMYGIKVRYTLGIKDTCDHVKALAAWWAKDWAEHGLAQFYATGSPEAVFMRPGLKQRIAAQLPGIGTKRAKCVASHFRSVREMILATREQWETIDKIGRKTAISVVEALKKEG